MKKLSAANLATGIPGTRMPLYRRDKVKSGVVHFGAGNFHRAHQAVYCDDLLCLGQNDWGITGISMQSSAVRDALAPQDFLYTQIALGTERTYRTIGSILSILVAPDEPEAVIDSVASSQTKIVTVTITEDGYALAAGEVDTSNPRFQSDLSALSEPQTIYGYLAAAIIRRCSTGEPGLTVICCDNIQNGGSLLKSGVKKILETHSPTALNWSNRRVAYASSMVDRVTPATDGALKQLVASHHGLEDAWPVAAEAFGQWIIEDNFAGVRPPFDRVGAEFVKDVAPYEQMKLRFLNAGHSMVSALGYLDDCRFIHEALKRPLILEHVRRALTNEVLPVSSVPEDCDALEYIDRVLDRFQNEALPYKVLQVGKDSSQKIQQRLFPTIDDAIARESSTAHLAFTLATWVEYIRRALEKSELDDPRREEFSRTESEGDRDMAVRFLELAGAGEFRFFENKGFMTSVHAHQQAILEKGISTALADLADEAAEEVCHA